MSYTQVLTNTVTPDLQSLIQALDQEYTDRFGAFALTYQKYHGLESLLCAVLLYQGKVPVGFGCINSFNTATAEPKRIYIAPAFRWQGLVTQIVSALEQAAKECGLGRMLLETGSQRPEAIALYEFLEFCKIKNFGAFA